MEGSQHHPGFLDLPGEIRNDIYEKVFRNIVTIVNGKALSPGILLASKQIYDEAIVIFYETTTFCFVNLGDGREWYTQIHSKYRNIVASLRYDSVEENQRKQADWPGPFMRRRDEFDELRLGTSLSDWPRSSRDVAIRKIEDFWFFVETRGIPRRTGILTVSRDLLLEELTKDEELYNDELSREAAPSDGEEMWYKKVWVTEPNQPAEIRE